ncbi:MAG: GAF domain-containing protein [Chloroflexi bacterium]|nr:GAF domain-containing protein [Chloroflexota bacterium]
MGEQGRASTQERRLGRIKALEQEQAALAARLEAITAQFEQRVDELRSLVEASRAVTGSLDLDQVVEAVLANVERLFKARDIWLLIYNEASGRLEVQGRRKAAGVSSGEFSLAPDEGAAGQVFTHRQPLFIADVATDPRFAHKERALRLGLRSMFGLPLVVGGDALGVLGVDSELFVQRGGPDPVQAELLGAFAAQAAVAIHNARQHRDEVQAQEALAALHLERAAAAQASERLKDDFISMMSHELRTPLTAIKGCARTLIRHEQTLDAETRRQFLWDIDEGAELLQRLVENLLDLQQVEAGVLHVRTEPTVVGRVAQKVVAEARRRRQDKRFVLQFPEVLPAAEADPLRLEQVLRNLIDNAAKYSPPGAEVRLAGSQRGDEVVVEVFNPGEGIAPEDQQRLFEPFSRPAGDLSAGNGAGLGLAICRRLIELQAGRIWVRSEPGQGATFGFSLPVAHRARR